MKKVLTILIVAALLQSCTEKRDTSIKGKWVDHMLDQDKTYHDFIAYFKADGTYDGIDGGKVVIPGGHYEQKGDTIILNDMICAPYDIGMYKMVLYAQDSMKLELISDSCDARREGTIPFRFKRMKQ
ncbi:MAG: hypothetical protein ABI266_08400 [Ginsengibacter sp.]